MQNKYYNNKSYKYDMYGRRISVGMVPVSSFPFKNLFFF